MVKTTETKDIGRILAQSWPLAVVGALTGYLVVIVARYARDGHAGFFAPDQGFVDDAAALPVRIFGVLGASLLLLGLMQFALFAWWRKRLDHVPRRAIGLALLLLALSAFLGLIGGDGRAWGGEFGANLARGFGLVLPTPLALLVATGLLVFAFVLARDWFFYEALRRWMNGMPAAEAFALGMPAGNVAPEMDRDLARVSHDRAASDRGIDAVRRPAVERLGTAATVDNRDIRGRDSFPDLEPAIGELEDVRPVTRTMTRVETIAVTPVDDMDEAMPLTGAPEAPSRTEPARPVVSGLGEPELAAAPAEDEVGEDEALDAFLAEEDLDFEGDVDVDFSMPLVTDDDVSQVITEEIPIVSLDDEDVDLSEPLGFGLLVDEDDAQVATAPDLREATAALEIPEVSELDEDDDEIADFGPMELEATTAFEVGDDLEEEDDVEASDELEEFEEEDEIEASDELEEFEEEDEIEASDALEETPEAALEGAVEEESLDDFSEAAWSLDAPEQPAAPAPLPRPWGALRVVKDEEDDVEEEATIAEILGAEGLEAWDEEPVDAEVAEAPAWVEHQTDLVDLEGVMETSIPAVPSETVAAPAAELEPTLPEPHNDRPSAVQAGIPDEEDWGSWLDDAPAAGPAPAHSSLDADDADVDEDTFRAAVRTCFDRDRCSVSLLQRHLGIGFAEAAACVDRMEREGIVGPYRGTGDRELLVELTDWESR